MLVAGVPGPGYRDPCAAAAGSSRSTTFGICANANMPRISRAASLLLAAAHRRGLPHCMGWRVLGLVGIVGRLRCLVGWPVQCVWCAFPASHQLGPIVSQTLHL